MYTFEHICVFWLKHVPLISGDRVWNVRSVLAGVRAQLVGAGKSDSKQADFTRFICMRWHPTVSPHDLNVRPIHGMMEDLFHAR